MPRYQRNDWHLIFSWILVFFVARPFSSDESSHEESTKRHEKESRLRDAASGKSLPALRATGFPVVGGRMSFSPFGKTQIQCADVGKNASCKVVNASCKMLAVVIRSSLVFYGHRAPPIFLSVNSCREGAVMFGLLVGLALSFPNAAEKEPERGHELIESYTVNEKNSAMKKYNEAKLAARNKMLKELQNKWVPGRKKGRKSHNSRFHLTKGVSCDHCHSFHCREPCAENPSRRRGHGQEFPIDWVERSDNES